MPYRRAAIDPVAEIEHVRPIAQRIEDESGALFEILASGQQQKRIENHVARGMTSSDRA